MASKILKNHKAKSKTYSYYMSGSFKKDDISFSFVTQLYKTGIYTILNNDPELQFSQNPSGMVKTQKRIQEDFDNDVIQDLVWGKQITVIKDDNGLYQEVK